jgi:hypothetical protein
VANPKLATLVDPFTATSINTALWNSVTSGAATLDTANDAVILSVPTTSGSTNTFGSGLLFDATAGASVSAQIGVAANGNGATKTVIKLTVDAGNSTSIRLENGSFILRVQNAGPNVDTPLGTYDPHAHRWWRLREAAGNWNADVSPDGLTWTTLASRAYTWSAAAVTFAFQAGANATEVVGNAATIANVNTRAGGPDNANWPRGEDAWAPYWNANAGTFPIDRYVEVSDRTRGTTTVQRGRQYETDQVRSGEAGLHLANPDGALDPVNTAGPWAGHIAPYQPYRKRAQWPATRNLLDQVAATGGTLGGYPLGGIPTGTNGPSIFSGTDSSGGTFTASTTAWLGGTVLQFSVPAGSATGARPVHTPRWSVVPGQTYTMQIRVRDVTNVTALTVQASLGWYTAGTSSPTSFSYGSSSVLSGGTAAGWTYLTLTATAPANAAGMDCGVALAANATATASLQVDGWQLEKGTVATSWTCPGVWWNVYAGWTERWPSTWDLDGLYGLVEPTAVDTFSLLSQRQLNDALTMELNAASPRFVYRLDDPSGSTSVADWTGQNSAAQLGISKYGAGSLTFGNAITSTDPTGAYTGSTGSVVTINNPNPGTLLLSGATFIRLTSAGILGPATPAWTRALAFRYTGPNPPAFQACMWSAMDQQRSGGQPSGSRIFLYIDASGHLVFGLAGPSTGAAAVPFSAGSTNVCDGDWHLAVFGHDATNGFAYISLDGNTPLAYSASAAFQPTGIIGDNLGGFVDATVGNGTVQNFKGDIAFAVEFPSHLNDSAIRNLYAAWKSACAGESSDARYARILRYAGYNGVTNIQTGLTTSMGPANLDGQDAMSALQAVVDTENGAHYVDAGGAVTFRARSARYNALTPMYTFGERVDLGEWPYEDLELDYDSTHLSNQVTVQQDGSGQSFYAVDSASVAAYFPRSMQRTINASDPNECQDAASYLLSRYRQPAQRVSTLKLHPSGNPALWPVCLSLELGTRIRVMRRPPAPAPPVQIECFVENIAWEWGDDNEVWLTLQCSPADLTPYGVLAAWHTTLAGVVNAGTNLITVNAGQDNTNPLSTQLAPGQQLVLGLGTANQETVTVSSAGSSGSPWLTGTVVLIANTTKSHALGDVVCEPLPAGVTNPATWDTVAVFDSIAFAY